MIKSRAIEAALVIGGAVGIATTVVNPVYTGASLAFMGGILGGASLSAQRAMKNEFYSPLSEICPLRTHAN